MNSELEKQVCVLCNAALTHKENYPDFIEKKNTLGFNRIEFCEKCELGIAFPRKKQEELNIFYNSGDYWHQTVNENIFQLTHEKIQAEWRVKKCLPLILSLEKKITLLDIGAGHGWIIYWVNRYFKDYVREIDIIEPDKSLKNMNIIKNCAFDINIIDSLDNNNKKYDLVFMNHVLEHTSNPYEFLKKVTNKIKSNGLVYVEVPNEDWKFKESVFPHTLFFKKNTLMELGDKLNLDILECDSFGRSRKLPNIFMKGIRRALLLLYSLSVRSGFYKLSSFSDTFLWKYNKLNSDGIWISCIYRC